MEPQESQDVISEETPVPVQAQTPEPEVEVDDDFDVMVPDVPMPTVGKDDTVKDELKGAFDFCFVGSGQGGGRIAESFWKMGYRRVLAVNTAEQDLATVRIPNKYAFASTGAGKDPRVAENFFTDKHEDVLDRMRRAFGPQFDRIFVTVGAAGGTGAGTCIPLVHVAKELMESLKLENKGVGVIVALPKNSEGKRANANAFRVMRDLLELVDQGVVSPLIILDNERIDQIHPGLAVDPFWATANSSVCALFNLFNTIAVKNSRYTSFDPKDFQTLLDSGTIVFGATPLDKWGDPTDISYAIRENLKLNILSGGIDLGTGSVAAAVVIGGKDILANIPMTNLDHGFDQLSRMLGPQSTVHQGIYRGNKETLVIYTAIGGLGRPTGRLVDLARIGDIEDFDDPEKPRKKR